jgi:hypothetical protein
VAQRRLVPEVARLLALEVEEAEARLSLLLEEAQLLLAELWLSLLQVEGPLPQEAA